MIAKLWFNSIFPPQATVVNGTDGIPYEELDAAQANIFSNLMVISTSLALGLLLGHFVTGVFWWLVTCWSCCDHKVQKKLRRATAASPGMLTQQATEIIELEQAAQGIKKEKKLRMNMFAGMFSAIKSPHVTTHHLIRAGKCCGCGNSGSSSEDEDADGSSVGSADASCTIQEESVEENCITPQSSLTDIAPIDSNEGAGAHPLSQTPVLENQPQKMTSTAFVSTV
jgi:hypothetical protein